MFSLVGPQPPKCLPAVRFDRRMVGGKQMMARLRFDLREDGSSVKWYGGRKCVLVLCTRQWYSWGSRQMRIHLVWVCGVKWTGRMDVGLGQTGYARPSQGEDRHRGSRTSHYRAPPLLSIIQIKQTCNCTLSNTNQRQEFEEPQLVAV